MKSFIIKLFISSVSVFLLANYILRGGIHVSSFGYAIIVALILSLLNASVKPILVALTLPISIFTLGLFLLVINTAMIKLAAYLVPNNGFQVDGWWWAFFFSILLSFLNSILEKAIAAPTNSQPNDNGMKIFDKDGNRVA